MEKTPDQVKGVQRLRAWAINPAEGGKIFQWGKPGDFGRCREFYRDKIPARMLDGWCATLHKLATGARPGQAPAERAARH